MNNNALVIIGIFLLLAVSIALLNQVDVSELGKTPPASKKIEGKAVSELGKPLVTGKEAESKKLQPSEPVSETQELEGVEPVKLSEEEAKSMGFSYCGDGACDPAESCNSCGDCTCKESEFCSKESNVCQEKELVGDGLCTDKEKAQGICVDCGCSEEKFCNAYNNKCMTPVTLSKETQDKIVIDWEAKNPQDKFVSARDSYLGDKAVKILEFDCSSVYYCRTILTVNASGEVEKEDHTT